MIARILKIVGLSFVGIVAIACLLFVGAIFLHNSTHTEEPQSAQPETSKGADIQAPEVAPPHPPTDNIAQPIAIYHDSDELMEPYKLSKNPYQWRGHSGILEMRMPVMANGTFMSYVPLPALKFERMISEHVAVYEVMVSNEGSEDEMAVILPNSEPPDVTKQWKIFMEGPLPATTAYGASLTLPAIRFEGYSSPPPPPPLPIPTERTPQQPSLSQ